MPYDNYQLAWGAPVLKGPNGEAWHTAFGLMKDGIVEGAFCALKCRFLTTCPLDALQYIGDERQIPQLPNENLESYRTRLLNAWTKWQYAGTKLGIQTAVQELGYTNVVVNQNSDWVQPPSPGYSAGQEWWRFWVIIGTPNNLTASWVVGDGTTVGSKAVGNPSSATAIANLKSVINYWTPPHAKLVALIVMIGGKSVGGFNVGDGTLVGGTAIYA